MPDVPQGGGWCREEGCGLPVHVYPLDDLREHVIDGGPCWCDPEEDEGLIVHNAADKREKFERGERKVS